MSAPRAARILIGSFALLLPATAAAYSERSVGSPGQVAWVRSAAHRFLTAELAGDGAGACAVLDAPLRAAVAGRTCAERWNARLARLRHDRGAHARLAAEQRALPAARVVVHGNVASIELPTPLLHGATRFLWTENCWMLEG